jgi:glutamate dehydrogenase/leucine dehydrogenase
MYTNSEIMSYIADEYAKVKGKEELAVVTGKPVGKGGSAGRDRATAMGGFFLLKELVKQTGRKPAELTVAIQGFGNAGATFANLCQTAGLKVVAVSDSQGGIYQKEGFKSIRKIEEHKQKAGSVVGLTGSQTITNPELLELEVDILIPAALEDQITEEIASHVQAKYILELANGPTLPQADEILFKKGIRVIPDVLANAGGVAVSYFEWLQNLENKYWSEEKVFSKLKKIMLENMKAVEKISQEKKTNLRMAAFILALRRLTKKWQEKCPQEVKKNRQSAQLNPPSP